MKNLSVIEIFWFLITQAFAGTLILGSLIYATQNTDKILLTLLLFIVVMFISGITILIQRFAIGFTTHHENPSITTMSVVTATITLMLVAGLIHSLTDHLFIRTITGLAFLPLYLIPIFGWFLATYNNNRKLAYNGISFGMFSIFVSILTISITSLFLPDNRLFQLTVSGPIIEELAKAIVVIVGIALIKKNIKTSEFITFGIMVGIGFTIVEDFAYIGNGIYAGDWYTTFLFRALSIPLHSIGPGLVAYGLSINNKRKAMLGLIFGLCTHVLWNANALGFDSLIDGNEYYLYVFYLVASGMSLLYSAIVLRMANNQVWK